MTDKARELLGIAIEEWDSDRDLYEFHKVMEEIRDFLSTPEPEQDEEPVAWMNGMRNLLSWDKFYEDMTPLFLHPAPRPDFVRLSEEEVDSLTYAPLEPYELICAVENRLAEKNRDR